MAALELALDRGARARRRRLGVRTNVRAVSSGDAEPAGITASGLRPRCVPSRNPAEHVRVPGADSTGSVRGLGAFSATYTWFARIGPATCPSDLGKPLAATGRISVEAKGELRFLR